jgi:hypothetical protein
MLHSSQPFDTVVICSYCECFAAGVYCSEPCSCQGCLNKPIHEEIVLSTRKQIEFRNPLAFAPKVIRMSDSGQETGVSVLFAYLDVRLLAITTTVLPIM